MVLEQRCCSQKSLTNWWQGTEQGRNLHGDHKNSQRTLPRLPSTAMSVRWGTGIQIRHLSPTKHLKHLSATPFPSLWKLQRPGAQSQGSWGVETDPHVRPCGGVQLYISDSRVAIPSQKLSQDWYNSVTVVYLDLPNHVVDKNSFKKVYKDILTISLEGFQELNLGRLSKYSFL